MSSWPSHRGGKLERIVIIQEPHELGSGPLYAVGYLVAFGAVEVAFVLLSFLGYLLITSIAFHKLYSYKLIHHKLSFIDLEYGGKPTENTRIS